jgi:RimJ/RimL family protein N-acetyltransferase
MALTLEPWTEDSLELLRRCNTEGMTTYLGGPETEQKLISRHVRYLGYAQDDPVVAWPLRVMVNGDAVGSLNYWKTDDGYEMGWAIAPEYQGRGYAKAAVLVALEHARALQLAGRFCANPSVDNAASNGVARSAGFTLLRQVDIEYPPGHTMRANEWVLDLR